MRTFAQKPKAASRTASAGSVLPAASSEAAAAPEAKAADAASAAAPARPFDFSGIPAVPRDGAAGSPAPRGGLEAGTTGDAALEREADRVGAGIGAALGPDALAQGRLPAGARSAAERRLGPLPPVTVTEAAADGLAPRALASAHGSMIRFRQGALSSGLPFYRDMLGHELVHVAQQQRLGPRTQHQIIGGVKVPDVTISAAAGETTVLIDGVPVLKASGQLDLKTDYDGSTLRFDIVVRSSAPVVPLRDLHFLDAMYPALQGRLGVIEPSMNLALPREGETKPPPSPPSRRVFGTFGRTSAPAAAEAPAKPAANPPAAAPAEAPKAKDAAAPAAEKNTNPYSSLDAAGRVAKVKELLDKWFTARDLVQVFQSAGGESEFLALEKAVDFGAVLDKMDEWEIVRLGATGPILPAFADRVNRARADYLERISREWGLQRAEIFALYIINTTTNDQVEAVLSLLAADRELYRSLAKMPNVAKVLADRGIDLSRFKDRDWKAVDIATGVGHALEGVMSTAPIVADSNGIAAMQQGMDLPEDYSKAVHDQDMAAFMQALTPGNVLLGAADTAFLGLPSAVKGVVYDLPRSIVGGVEELAKGNVTAGVEMLTVPVIIVISVALGARSAFRRARVAALLELTGEGKALYDSLKGNIGVSGIQRVAGYVQKSEAARLLVAEAKTEGILALHNAKGDVAAARALMAERQALIKAAGDPTKVTTGMPGTRWARPNELPYTPPPDMQVIRPGNPLKVESLDPTKRYLWVLDEQGDVRIASEGQGNLYPKRRPLDPPHPQAGQTMIKHGDLAPGPGGMERGVARAGGELHAEFGADGKPTGNWIMDHESSYAYEHTRLDGKGLNKTQLEAARGVLGAAGTDISKIKVKQ